MALPYGGAIFEKEVRRMRKLMWFTIGFVCACILGVFAWDSWLCWLFAVASACFLVTLVAKRWIRFLRILTAFSLGLSIGIGWFAVYDSMFLQFPKEIDGKTASASMTISDYSIQTDYGMRADAEMNLDGRVYKLRVYLEKTEEEIELKPGDRIRGIFQFKSTLRGSAEEATYHSADGIYLLAYQDGEISIDVTDSVPVRYYPATWKKYILDRIDQPAILIECGFLTNKEEAALLKNNEYQAKLSYVLSRSILDFLCER
jgi:hypothetical protein